MRVKWVNTLSGEFSVKNGIKLGGVISPLLYYIHIDELIKELANSGVGCYMGGVYAGIFRYADDLKLLTPSVNTFDTMLNICLDYAARLDLFNDKPINYF